MIRYDDDDDDDDDDVLTLMISSWDIMSYKPSIKIDKGFLHLTLFKDIK